MKSVRLNQRLLQIPLQKSKEPFAKTCANTSLLCNNCRLQILKAPASTTNGLENCCQNKALNLTTSEDQEMSSTRSIAADIVARHKNSPMLHQSVKTTNTLFVYEKQSPQKVRILEGTRILSMAFAKLPPSRNFYSNPFTKRRVKGIPLGGTRLNHISVQKLLLSPFSKSTNQGCTTRSPPIGMLSFSTITNGTGAQHLRRKELIPATAFAVRELAVVVVLRPSSAVRRRGAGVLVCRLVGPRALALVGLLSASARSATLLVVLPAPVAPTLGGGGGWLFPDWF
jgi:hypothetical protein